MNYYLTGIEGMPKLLDCCEDPLQYFKKNLYSDTFRKMYQANYQTFEAIENGYNSVVDYEQFITNMAEALVSYGVEKVNSCKGKRAQEKMLMDLNMSMAVYVFPMVLEYKGKSSRPLADKLMEGWKREFPKSNIQCAEYEYIEKGFHKKFCYITTAVCESLGKPDDCYELTTLRDYRDTYLSALDQGDELISGYYDMAPSIVKHINQQPDASSVYRDIWTEYLSPCISMIEQNQMEECRDLYTQMVFDLKEKYFFSNAAEQHN